MNIPSYIDEIRRLYTSGQTTKHSTSPSLTRLFSSTDPELTVIKQPKHVTEVGAPDFVFMRGKIAVGWCKATDIDKDVRCFPSTDHSKAQKDLYKNGLRNLIATNGRDFEFIRDGKCTDFISIADLPPGLPANTENFVKLEHRLRDFVAIAPLRITSSKKLAGLMVGNAAIIKDVLGRTLAGDYCSRCRRSVESRFQASRWFG